VHTHPDSVAHWEEQPSPLTRFQSSHASVLVLIPSPQTEGSLQGKELLWEEELAVAVWTQTEGEPVHVQPASTVRICEQPSPFA
jgi:hypothetical protein